MFIYKQISLTCKYMHPGWPIKGITVKPVLRDHCHERPPVLKDHKCFAESPTFQCKWTCYQRPPVLRDHIFMANCGGLSRQVPLYLKLLLKASWTKCAKQTPCKHWWIYSSQKVTANYVNFKFRVYLLFTTTLKLCDKLAIKQDLKLTVGDPNGTNPGNRT